MKKMVMTMVAGAVAMGAAGVNFQVKNVTAQQRFPWNGKVDVDFLIESDGTTEDFKVTLECYDNVGKTNVPLRTVKYNDSGSAATEFTLKKGQHRLTWNGDADAGGLAFDNVAFSVFATVTAAHDTDGYVIIDLSGGANASSYPVTTRTGVPSGGWTDEYKTTKLVLRRCAKGSDPLGRYTLTHDFYAGVFEVTQKQWVLVMGSNPVGGYGKSDDRPVYYVSYNMIRGTGAGAGWPGSSAVDASSFIGRMRARTGLNTLDLPTEAQWEYACRAGTTTTYNTGDGESALAAAGWYSANSGSATHPVGQKQSNAWGLYDMHGNVWEWCLDWYGANLSGTDPVGAASGSYRRRRGGSWHDYAEYCTSSYRSSFSPSYGNGNLGFRLFRTVP